MILLIFGHNGVEDGLSVEMEMSIEEVIICSTRVTRFYETDSPRVRGTSAEQNRGGCLGQ